MIGVIIATDGKYCEGLEDSASMLSDTADRLAILDFNEDPNINITKVIQKKDRGEGVIILTDIANSNATKAAIQAASQIDNTIKIVTGVNLPMIVALLSIIEEEDDIETLADNLYQSAEFHIKEVN